MSNKTIEENDFSTIIADDSVLTTVSGSSDEPLETKEEEKRESVIMPLDLWPVQLTKKELEAYRTYKLSCFPDLFEVRNLENDKFSTVPTLSLTKPVRFYSTLIEGAMLARDEEKKKKVNH